MMDLPNAQARKYILLKYLEESDSEELNISKVVNKTEDLSGAYLREIVVTAYMISQERGRKINDNILHEAAISVMEMKNNVSPVKLKNTALYM